MSNKLFYLWRQEGVSGILHHGFNELMDLQDLVPNLVDEHNDHPRIGLSLNELLYLRDVTASDLSQEHDEDRPLRDQEIRDAIEAVLSAAIADHFSSELIVAELAFQLHIQGTTFAEIGRRLQIPAQHASDIYEYIINRMRIDPRLIRLNSERTDTRH